MSFQNEILNDVRQDGAIYKVAYLESNCKDWRTELTNQETGETFRELEFSHDISSSWSKFISKT